MPQNFPAVDADDLISASRQPLQDRDEAAASFFAGTAFPDAALGRPCYRTDQNKLYQCVQVSPAVWKLIIDLAKTTLHQEDASALFAATSHDHAGQFAAASHEHPGLYAGIGHSHPQDADLTALAALSGTGMAERTGADAWALRPVTAAGRSMLAAADASAQRTLLALGSAATMTPQEVVTAGAALPLAGGTLSGALTGTTMKSAGIGAASSGFQVADGTDLAALFANRVQSASIGATVNCIAAIDVTNVSGRATIRYRYIYHPSPPGDCNCGGQ